MTLPYRFTSAALTELRQATLYYRCAHTVAEARVHIVIPVLKHGRYRSLGVV